MVRILVKLEDRQERTLDMVKNKFGFKNKNDAIKYLINEYEKECLETKYVKKRKKAL